MRCANQAGRVALGFELIEPLGSAQGTVISTPRAGLSAGSRCRGSRRRPNCTICGVRDVGEPDFHFGASQTDGSNRDADRPDPSSDDVVEASADFRRLAVGSRRSLRAGRSSIRCGIVDIGDSAQPFLVIEKSKFAAHRIICASVLDGEARRALFGQGFGCGPISRGVGAQKSVIAAPSAGVKVATESLAIGALSIWRSLHIASAIGRLEPYRDSRLKRLGRMAF